MVAIFSIMGVTTLLMSINNSGAAMAICSEINDPNVSCHEQHNSHSNVATSTTSTTTEDESEPVLCTDLKCNLGEEYMPDLETGVMDDPLDLLE
jgi:hypothetical protein